MFFLLRMLTWQPGAFLYIERRLQSGAPPSMLQPSSVASKSGRGVRSPPSPKRAEEENPTQLTYEHTF
jgi:hypothetical protein